MNEFNFEVDELRSDMTGEGEELAELPVSFEEDCEDIQADREGLGKKAVTLGAGFAIAMASHGVATVKAQEYLCDYVETKNAITYEQKNMHHGTEPSFSNAADYELKQKREDILEKLEATEETHEAADNILEGLAHQLEEDQGFEDQFENAIGSENEGFRRDENDDDGDGEEDDDL